MSQQPFPNIQRAVITASGNGVNLPTREVVIQHDTLIDMGLFCPMSSTFDNTLEEARERLRVDCQLLGAKASELVTSQVRMVDQGKR